MWCSVPQRHPLNLAPHSPMPCYSNILTYLLSTFQHPWASYNLIVLNPPSCLHPSGQPTLDVRSRWNTPLACRYCRPWAMSRARRSLTGQDRGSGELSSCSRVPPFIYWGHSERRRGMNVKVSVSSLPFISQGTLKRIAKVQRVSQCSRVPIRILGLSCPIHMQLFKFKLLSLNKIKHSVPQSQ